MTDACKNRLEEGFDLDFVKVIAFCFISCTLGLLALGDGCNNLKTEIEALCMETREVDLVLRFWVCMIFGRF